MWQRALPIRGIRGKAGLSRVTVVVEPMQVFIFWVWVCYVMALSAQRQELFNLKVGHRDDGMRRLFLLLAASVIVGVLVGFWLAYLYVSAVGVMPALMLVIVASLMAGLLGGGLYVWVGVTAVSRAAFVVWPLAAACAYLLIQRLPPPPA
jgi:hypothetical protein